MTDADDLIQDFEAAIIAFEAGSMKLADAKELDAVRAAFARLDQGIGRLKNLRDYLIPQLALKTRGAIATAGGASLEPKWGAARTEWHHEKLKPVVIEEILRRHVDPETGVIDAPYTQLMAEMLDAVSFSSWKVTVVRDKYGIDVDEFCTKSAGRQNVIVRFPD